MVTWHILISGATLCGKLRLNKKEWENGFVARFLLYGCFLSTSINATPTTTIKIAKAATAGIKY
jgi:hypothetical protein